MQQHRETNKGIHVCQHFLVTTTTKLKRVEDGESRFPEIDEQQKIRNPKFRPWIKKNNKII